MQASGDVGVWRCGCYLIGIEVLGPVSMFSNDGVTAVGMSSCGNNPDQVPRLKNNSTTPPSEVKIGKMLTR